MFSNLFLIDKYKLQIYNKHELPAKIKFVLYNVEVEDEVEVAGSVEVEDEFEVDIIYSLTFSDKILLFLS